MGKTRNKVMTRTAAIVFARTARKAGKTIVTTNGCFDILHVGHLRYLEEAKKIGDVLIVGINSDRSTRAIKGRGRPVVPEKERAELVAALKPVDAAFIFSERDPRKWISNIKPHIHAKGTDRTMDQILEKNVVEKWGGKVVLVPVTNGKSTTNIVRKILGQSPIAKKRK